MKKKSITWVLLFILLRKKQNKKKTHKHLKSLKSAILPEQSLTNINTQSPSHIHMLRTAKYRDLCDQDTTVKEP